jgi:hypothetical protein
MALTRAEKDLIWYIRVGMRCNGTRMQEEPTVA